MLKSAKVVLIMAIFLLHFEGFAQKDSTSHIYFGISAILAAPVWHTVGETSVYVTHTSPGGSVVEGFDYQGLHKTFNMSSGILVFLRLSHYFEMSFGLAKDFRKYKLLEYNKGGVVLDKSYYGYRIPVNLNWYLFKCGPVRLGSIISGALLPGPNVFEGMLRSGISVFYNNASRLSWSLDGLYTYKDVHVFGNTKRFHSYALKLRLSYIIFKS